MPVSAGGERDGQVGRDGLSRNISGVGSTPLAILQRSRSRVMRFISGRRPQRAVAGRFVGPMPKHGVDEHAAPAAA
jgi:hypothetical protein